MNSDDASALSFSLFLLSLYFHDYIMDYGVASVPFPSFSLLLLSLCLLYIFYVFVVIDLVDELAYMIL